VGKQHGDTRDQTKGAHVDPIENGAGAGVCLHQPDDVVEEGDQTKPGKEDAKRRDERSGDAREQVAEKGCRGEDRPGRKLADRDRITLFDLAGGKKGGSLPSPASGNASALAFSADGKFLASAHSAGFNHAELRLWDVATLKQRALLPANDIVHDVAFHPNGHTLASVSWDGLVRTWNRENGKLLHAFSHPGMIFAVAYSHDGWALASGGEDRAVRLWKLPGGSPGRVLPGHAGAVGSFAFSPDDATLAAAAGGSVIAVAAARSCAAAVPKPSGNGSSPASSSRTSVPRACTQPRVRCWSQPARR